MYIIYEYHQKLFKRNHFQKKYNVHNYSTLGPDPCKMCFFWRASIPEIVCTTQKDKFSKWALLGVNLLLRKIRKIILLLRHFSRYISIIFVSTLIKFFIVLFLYYDVIYKKKWCTKGLEIFQLWQNATNEALKFKLQ